MSFLTGDGTTQDVGEDNGEVKQWTQQIQDILVQIRTLTIEELESGRSAATEVRARRREIHDELGCTARQHGTTGTARE